VHSIGVTGMKTTMLMIAGALLAAPAGAADMTPKIKARPASSDNIHAYGDKNASCAVWTDGCRRCDRGSGTPSCSNIGIACQPGPVRCESESTPAK
jgi:hypothetical protein